MANIDTLIQTKKDLKKRTPDFIRQDAHKKARVGSKWRKPKGLQSKVRLCKKGYRRKLKEGYRTPVELRGHDSKGMMIIKVNNVAELKDVDPKKDVVLVSRTLGLKKKIELLEEAKKKGIKITNIKDVESFIKTKKEIKEKKKKELEDKKQKKEKAKPKKEKKDLVDKVEEETKEEKKKQETQEKEKVLTKKN